MASNYLILNESDNVLVALSDLKPGMPVNHITVLNEIPRAHKMAIKDIKKDEMIIKYGSPIGRATTDIKKGEHVHVHNLKTNLSGELSYTYNPSFKKIISKLPLESINVYLRDNGEVGIRNEIWIIPTVGCVNARAQKIVNEFKKRYLHNKVDAIVAFPHPYGCSQMGDDHQNTLKSLQNIALHPNAGGVLVLGLGCENNQLNIFKETLGNYNEKRIKFLVSQEVEDEIESGVALLKEIYDTACFDKRTPQPITKLNVGLKCGGSDGFSGITANPLLGQLSDYLVSHGGTAVLTEVPEMFGAEESLMNRANSPATFDKIVNLINGFKYYYQAHNQVVYENPSPGNKNGGISTLEDKSLGCTQKSGNCEIVDVLKTTDKIKIKGLNLLEGPGNDLIATTTLGMAGCQIVFFSTGRGTPFGGFIPTVKVSTNSQLFKNKPHWIDFNAGELLEGKTMEQLLVDLIKYLVDVASGKLTNNEIEEFREIAIFKSGVTL